MKLNMGSADRIVRLIAVVIIAALYFTDQITGTAAIILGIVAVAFILTSAVGFCPMYAPFRFSTKKEVSK
jgi:hypothetical protein